MAKVLVISDVHGNKEQLKTLISENEFTHIIFCGDMIKDLEEINHPNIIKVRGNWDEWVIDRENLFDEEVVIEPSELDHVEILRKKREAQRKLNSEIPSSIIFTRDNLFACFIYKPIFIIFFA